MMDNVAPTNVTHAVIQADLIARGILRHTVRILSMMFFMSDSLRFETLERPVDDPVQCALEVITDRRYECVTESLRQD